MNLKQLKGMIAEEYRYWLAEQPIDAPGAPGGPMMPPPGIEVGPNDVDAMGGGEDSEATLRQIYDMLKDYFEGGGAGAAGAAPAAPEASKAPEAPGADMDMDDMDDMEDDGDEDEDEDEDEEEVSEKKSKKESKKELKERFQKLANIIKG